MILELRGEMQNLNKQLNGIREVSVNGDARNASGVSGIYIISNNCRNNTNTLDRKNNSLWMSSLPAKSSSSSTTATTFADGGRTAVLPQAAKAVTAISNGYLSSASGIPCSVVARNEAPPSTATTTTDSGSARSNTFNDIMSDYHSGSNNYGQNEASSGGGGGGGAGGGEYHFTASASSTPSPTQKNPSSNGSLNMKNGSRVKLLASPEDQSNAQGRNFEPEILVPIVFAITPETILTIFVVTPTKCSVFRGLVLCICLNVTYANIVRFPRELDQFGSAYLIPYLVLLFLVGLPIILLEISVGQFLGQGANHTWRASPIFKGACIVSRFASWLSSIWVSLQAILAVAYIGMFIIKSLPFNECVGDIKLSANGYKVVGNSGQECIQKTFLTPFWENPLYFALLAIGLIVMWTVIMFCTHSAKVLRRCVFFFGLVGFALLSALTSWEVGNSLQRAYFPELWPFDRTLLLSSNIWFNALLQVIFATNIGFGVLPMVTGKFLYKGDAVRTSVVYLCFNLLINAISVTLFMVQFDVSVNGATDLIELKPITAIYDRILNDPPKVSLLAWLVPALIYTLIVISAVVSTTVAIYTSTRLVPRHPNYVISLIALIVAIVSLAVPNFIVARVLDTRIVGTLVISALVFDLIAITWIYGVKNIYTDLEFSIGRPIFKGWMFMWCLCPVLLTSVLVWWCSDDDQFDLLAEFMPRWLPILFVLTIILLISCIEIFKQVEYNFFGMICEAAKSAKEWGPADPLARHAWKQWRTVCQDTGRRDFTLRRRGTRDYTHSIKKGQYSVSSKYGGTQNWKSSTPGNSSPNYSGSVFGDSAIEEDISVDKYPGINSQFVPFQSNDGKPLRYSSHLKRPSNERRNLQIHNIPEKQHREVVYIRRLSSDDHSNHATRIEITPSNESITYGTRNPIGRSANGNVSRLFASSNATAARIEKQKVENSTTHTHAPFSNTVSRVSAAAAVAKNSEPDGEDHVCWRKFAVNAEEYSTEL